jgi:uncharacterized protein with PhoU and TrkA domain
MTAGVEGEGKREGSGGERIPGYVPRVALDTVAGVGVVEVKRGAESVLRPQEETDGSRRGEV